MEDDLLKYFIERTDDRLTKMDQKIDELLSFKWQVFGGSFVLGILGGLFIDFIQR